MALSEVILVCLTERPMSGYDLAKNFDASIGFFWRASHQQIYRELGSLRTKGYVESQEIAQKGKPNRIVHTITDDGRAALLNWSAKPPKQPSFKDELWVKFYALDGIDIAAFREQISLRLEQHHNRLQTYHRIKTRFYDNRELTLNQKGKLIALELGIASEEHNIKAMEGALVKVAEV